MDRLYDTHGLWNGNGNLMRCIAFAFAATFIVECDGFAPPCYMQPHWRFADVTSVPACRDAPCNETKYRCFEFKRLKICEYIKFYIYFYLVITIHR